MSDIIKPSAKYEIGQYFVHKEKRKLFKIVDAEWQGTIQSISVSKVKEKTKKINDWLYNIQYAKRDGKHEYGRYYENRLTKECTLVDNQDMPRTIYE